MSTQDGVLIADTRLGEGVVSDSGGILPRARTSFVAQAIPPTEPRLQLREMRPIERLTGGRVTGEFAVPGVSFNFPETVTKVSEAGNVGVWTGGGPAGLNVDPALLNGRFNVFASNQNRSLDGRPIYRSLAFSNPGDRAVTVRIDANDGAYASVTTSDAPYIDARRSPDEVIPPNQERVVRGFEVNGPGQAAAALSLANRVMPGVPTSIVVPPGQTVTLPAEVIPFGQERVTSGAFTSDGDIHAGFLFSRQPQIDAASIIARGILLPTSSADREPTRVGAPGNVVFGRVAGVEESQLYIGYPTNNVTNDAFVVTDSNANAVQDFAFNTKRGNDFGLGSEEGRVLAGNPGSAREVSPLNYNTQFRIGGDLINARNQESRVRLYLNTPITTPDSRPMRQTFEVIVPGAGGQLERSFVTVSQSQQTRGQTPIADFNLPPGATGQFIVRSNYAANQTGPHTLSIVTGDASNLREAASRNRPR